jgi:hypothetical protein
MLTKCQAASAAVCLMVGAAWCGTESGQVKGGKYASERSPYTFVGATRVVMDGFDPADKDAKSATLQLDQNEVNFSSFGEARITAVFYKPFAVKLTRLNLADPSGKDRRIFSVELPSDLAADLGKNSLRLVTWAGAKSEPAGIRLLLVNPENKVTQVLELRSAGN